VAHPFGSDRWLHRQRWVGWLVKYLDIYLFYVYAVRIHGHTCSGDRCCSRSRSRRRRRRRRRVGHHGTRSVDAILVREVLVVDVIQIGLVEMQPARVVAEIEVDRHTGQLTEAELLARRQRSIFVVADSVYRVLVGQLGPLRLTRCSRPSHYVT